MLSIHRCGYNWMYRNGDCYNCRLVTSNETTTGNVTRRTISFYASNPSTTVVGSDGIVYAKQEKKPIKVKARKVRRKRND